MTFNSLEFAFFISIFFICYGFIYKSNKARDVFLLISSYLFYSAWYWEYASLIVISTLADWFIVRSMAKLDDTKKRKILLACSITINLGILAFFKYFNFFVDSIEGAVDFFGMDISILRHELILPIGISFYTFQTMSYTIDVYRRKLNPEPSLLKFAVYVSFFPQLVAGPIVRASNFLPQLRRDITVSRIQVFLGVFLVYSGLFKKIVIADSLALLGVDAAFDNPSAYSSLDLLFALYGYTFQIYCDFSGYSDIAIGLALMMGFKLPINFNRPYIATNPSDFWKRWHISLSTWLRDYLYISLGGNRFGRFLTYRNLALTMVLGGLWHGAAWTYIIWGAMHGFYLVVHRLLTERSYLPSIPKFVSIIFFFHLIALTWIPFRSSDMHIALDFVKGLIGIESGGTGVMTFSPLFYFIIIVAMLMHFIPKNITKKRLQNLIVRQNIIVQCIPYTLFLLIFLGFSVDVPQFIYFQF